MKTVVVTVIDVEGELDEEFVESGKYAILNGVTQAIADSAMAASRAALVPLRDWQPTITQTYWNVSRDDYDREKMDAVIAAIEIVAA